MPEFIPYGRQCVDEEDIAAVVEVLRSDYLTTGPAVGRFEAALRRATGAGHAVALNSGTSALHAMYFAAGIGPGDEIVTSPLTFVATANAALYVGATVRFVDVEPDTGNLDPDLVDAAINERTKAIVPIDYAGHPADYDRLRAITDRHGLKLLADAAHSLGATYKGRPVGALADASELSFHPVKPITTAEGGAVVTDDPALAQRVARFRTHGITKDPTELDHPGEGPWWYEQHDLGFNYRLTDVQAALGASQLRKLERFISRRRAIASAYDAALADLDALRLPGRRADVEPGWHLYVIRTRDPQRRRPLFEHLRAQGLGVQVHYLPVHWHPYYAGLGYRRGQCPVVESFYASAISLPMFPGMDDDDVSHVVDSVRTAAPTLA
jgi:UDP-4-amino-4,6-dideoxy-N-acetyl-beta-L-altrosamine transaminase